MKCYNGYQPECIIELLLNIENKELLENIDYLGISTRLNDRKCFYHCKVSTSFLVTNKLRIKQLIVAN